MVECLEQSRQKLKLMIKEMKEDPKLFEEAMAHLKGGGIQEKYKKSMNEYNRDAALKSAMTHAAHGAVSQNVRVRLPMKD